MININRYLRSQVLIGIRIPYGYEMTTAETIMINVRNQMYVISISVQSFFYSFIAKILCFQVVNYAPPREVCFLDEILKHVIHVLYYFLNNSVLQMCVISDGSIIGAIDTANSVPVICCDQAVMDAPVRPSVHLPVSPSACRTF